jgi:integrase
MKAAREHRVPLTEPTLAILTKFSEAKVSDHVFPGQRAERPLSVMALEMVLRRMGVKNATIHGFRSSFRDWAGNETRFPRELAEHALAHVIGDKAEQAYRRSDALSRRRELMTARANFLERGAGGHVVALRRPV